MIAYPLFERLIAETLPGAIPQMVNARALAVWAMIHGMAMLKLRRRLNRRYLHGQSDLQVIRAMLRHM